MKLVLSGLALGVLLLAGCNSKKCADYSNDTKANCEAYSVDGKKCVHTEASCSAYTCKLNTVGTASTYCCSDGTTTCTSGDTTNCTFTAAAGTVAASCASKAAACQVVAGTSATTCCAAATCTTANTSDAGCNALSIKPATCS